MISPIRALAGRFLHPNIAQAAYETELNAMHIAAGLGSCEAMEALSHGTAEGDLPRRWATGGDLWEG